MENALLIGLSRQTALQRELDVVANNIANVNTTGFKADGAVFAEFLQHARQLRAVRRRRPPHELRAGPHDLARHEPGHGPADRRSARRRHRRRRHAGGADRRAASATPATARCSSTPSASWSPPPATRCWATAARSCCRPTDRDIVITKDGTIKVREGASAEFRFAPAASCGSSRSPTRSSCRRTAPRPSPRRTASRRRRCRRHVACRAGRDREVERARRWSR